MSLTPARIGLGHVGGSLPTTAQLAFQLAHARARDAVQDPLDVAALLERLARAGLSAVCVRSMVADRTEYLQRPDRGRRLDAEARDRLARLGVTRSDACFVIADGLSARAAQRHAPAVVAALLPRLVAEGWSVAPVVVAEQGRVALGDEIGALLGAGLVAVLLGERPGLSSPDSLGIYLTWAPAPGRRDSDRNCISNVRPDGLLPELAADRLHFLMTEARRRRLTGVGLKDETRLLRDG